MEIKSDASKLVKPSTPTPSALRNYNISFFDEQVINIKVPLILCYNASQNDTNIFNRLENSLSKALTDFYPLAGRYIRHGSFIDCSDQGALYVQAKANFKLAEFLSLEEWGLKFDMMNDLLPCAVGAADDEADDPLLSVKVTTFECSSVAIGMCLAHKFSDMSTTCTFIDNWALRSQEIVDESALRKCSPIFSFPHRFPKRGVLDKTPIYLSSGTGDQNMTEVFTFKGSAIYKMREKLICKDKMMRRPSKVQLIVTLLWKALVSIDRASDGQPKMSVACQAFNLRDKVVPKLPDNSCGNIVTFTIARIDQPNKENIDFQGFFELLHDSINKIKDTCATLGDKEYEHEQLIQPLMKSSHYRNNKDVNCYTFSSWCKFSFYKADFGWGKSVWRGIGRFPGQNMVIMMDDQEGDGVEAWVYLNEKRMCQLKQDPDIKTYAT